jgi:hypothetical protein
MICQEVMELMQRYIDDDLDQQEISRLMDHVGQCSECAAMLNRLQHLSSNLEQLPRVVPRYSLVDAILPELEKLSASAGESTVSTKEVDTNRTSRTARSNRPGRNFLPKLSGVVALGVVAGLLLFSNPSQWFAPSGQHNEAAPGLTEDISHSKREPAVAEQPQASAEPFAGIAKAPEGNASNDATGTADSTPAIAMTSPDGKWKAIVMGGTGTLQIWNEKDQSTLFTKAHEGSLSRLTWSDDSLKLTYDWTDLNGKTTSLVFDVVSVTETKR